jgi:hypothetical protein
MNLKNNKVNNSFIITSTRGDVTGDKIPDNIYLLGQKLPDSPFVQQITLVVKDGKSGKVTSVLLKENAGYNPTLFLEDFNQDGVKDILIRIDSGGSGAFTYDYIYSFLKNVPRVLFDSDVYNDTYKYAVNYRDYYKVEVFSQKNQTKYILDISYKGAEYLNEIYNSDGKLKDPIEGFVNPLSSLFPVDVDMDGVYDLLAFQKIAGRYNADSLGYIQNFLRWDKGDFTLFNQYVGIYGVEL